MCDGRARLKCAGCGERVCAPCYGLPRLPRGTWYCDLCRSTGWPSQVTSHPSCALCQRAHVPGAAHVGPMMSTTAGELVHATCAHYLPGASAEDTHAHTHARTRTRTRTRAHAPSHSLQIQVRASPSTLVAAAATPTRSTCSCRVCRSATRPSTLRAHSAMCGLAPPTRAPRAPPRSSAHIAPPTHHTTSPTRAHPPHPPVLFSFSGGTRGQGRLRRYGVRPGLPRFVLACAWAWCVARLRIRPRQRQREVGLLRRRGGGLRASAADPCRATGRAAGRRRRARATDAGCQPASNWRQPCRPGDGGAPRQPRPADARPRPRRKPRRADAPHGRVARRSAAQGKAQEGESRVRVRQADLARVAGARRAVVREEILGHLGLCDNET